MRTLVVIMSLILLLWLASCSKSNRDRPTPARSSSVPQSASGRDAAREERSFEKEFDRNFEGSSFSNELLYSATSVRAVIERFRNGVVYRDEDDISASIAFPLTANLFDSEGKKSTPLSLSSVSEWFEFQDSQLSDFQYALIACANTSNVRVYRNKGFAIGNGMVWFSGPETEIRVRGVNLAPISSDAVVSSCSYRSGKAEAPERPSRSD